MRSLHSRKRILENLEWSSAHVPLSPAYLGRHVGEYSVVVERQWQVWGRPPIEWIPGGHMTFAFSLRRIVGRMRDFHASLR